MPLKFSDAAIQAAVDKLGPLEDTSAEHALVLTGDLKGASLIVFGRISPKAQWAIKGSVPWHEPLKNADLRAEVTYAW